MVHVCTVQFFFIAVIGRSAKEEQKLKFVDKVSCLFFFLNAFCFILSAVFDILLLFFKFYSNFSK